MRRHQRMPLCDLRDMQLEKLRELVSLASSESIFYRERFSKLGLSVNDLKDVQSLSKFPVTTKDDIASNFPDGIVIQSRRTPDWQYVGTRGTTRRVMVVSDFERRDLARAATIVGFCAGHEYRVGDRQVSIPPDACSVHCGLEGQRAASVTGHVAELISRRSKWGREWISDLRGLVMENWVNRNVVLPPLAIDGDDDSLKDCVAELRRIRPVQLMALPEYLRVLAEYIHRTGDRPGDISILRPIGANFPMQWREEVESAFGGRVREHYGSREMDTMAFECPEANGLHQMMDRYIIEVVRDNTPVAEGEVGNVIVTDLDNLAMPLIRYQIGDLARISYSECKCGRATPRIFMEGRVEDAFVTDAGKLLTSEGISNHFAAEPDVFDFELSETVSGGLRLRIVPRPGETIDQQSLVDRFRKWSGETRPISVRTTTLLRPEESGKFRHSKSRSFHSLTS